MVEITVNALIKTLGYTHGVLVLACPERRGWDVVSWEPDKRDHLFVQGVISEQPHEATAYGFGPRFVLAFCYPACTMSLLEGGVAMIDSIGFPSS